MNTNGQPSELGPLAFAALGIVFGDIGTSPVIALKQALVVVDYSANPAFLMGVVSMIFWALMLVVSIKYLVFITRADNQGEGGIFALLALLRASPSGSAGLLHMALMLALIAAGLLFADSLLTPALSIVAAMEGLESVTENVSHWIIWGSISIVIGLFTIQQFGTGHIGRYFGAVMGLWFIVISGLGVSQIIETPFVLEAIHPGYALGLILDLGPIKTIGVLGAVLLAVTGAEAIYADMGHFGRKPISIAWFSIAFTALTLNYRNYSASLG
jgi:KUP system potassium uptake protein